MLQKRYREKDGNKATEKEGERERALTVTLRLSSSFSERRHLPSGLPPQPHQQPHTRATNTCKVWAAPAPYRGWRPQRAMTKDRRVLVSPPAAPGALPCQVEGKGNPQGRTEMQRAPAGSQPCREGPHPSWGLAIEQLLEKERTCRLLGAPQPSVTSGHLTATCRPGSCLRGLLQAAPGALTCSRIWAKSKRPGWPILSSQTCG